MSHAKAAELKLYEELLAAYKENKTLLHIKISHLEDELADRDSPASVAGLREQMHHYRRQCDEILAKLREAEAFIEQYQQTIADRDKRISELMLRCTELEREKDLQASNR